MHLRSFVLILEENINLSLNKVVFNGKVTSPPEILCQFKFVMTFVSHKIVSVLSSLYIDRNSLVLSASSEYQPDM